ncbi:MAG: SDR family NAD(P)-dependent oxidoreductase [Steroidobacteraceae bacterium]
MNLNGVPVIISGGASGLGAATAELFAASGAKVAIFDLNVATGEALAKQLGGVFAKVDVTSEQEVTAGLDKAQQVHGIARVLVNCAGIGVAAKTVGKGVPHPIDSFRKVIEINLIGTFNCIAKFAARASQADPIGKEERGVIINTASVAAFEGQVGQAAYSASKGGLVGMTLTIARDLADRGVRCLTIAPGLFMTPLFQGASPQVIDSLTQQTLFPKRLGDPAEFALLCKSIVENPMLNGDTIRLDGGIRMQPR